MGVRFEAMRGDTEQLRAAMAHIRDHLPADAAPGPTMDPRMLAAIGIEAADILDFALPVEGGHAAVQLLITPSLGLRINRLVASAERDVLGEAERSLPLDGFYTGYMKNQRRPGELLWRIEWDLLGRFQLLRAGQPLDEERDG